MVPQARWAQANRDRGSVVIDCDDDLGTRLSGPKPWPTTKRSGMNGFADRALRSRKAADDTRATAPVRR